jgi:signal transduction histidine kinase
MISDGIDFQSAFDEGQMQINCDASQIEQALINVLMNAKEAVEEKGQISFTAESYIPTREKRPLYPGLTENCYILITIRDNGVGIPTQIQNQIFDPLFPPKSAEPAPDWVCLLWPILSRVTRGIFLSILK